MLIQYMYDQNEDSMRQIGLDQDSFTLIKDLIKGESTRYARSQPEKLFLFDIVSNKRNSFDLDKLDYLNRDLKHTQINKAQLDYDRITMNAAVIENKIAYNTKILNDINIVYERRFELFK